MQTYWKTYPVVGSSIALPKCNLSSEQVRFVKTLPGYLELDMSLRRKSSQGCTKRKKRIQKAIDFDEVLQMRKTRSYYDPQSFRRGFRSPI